jgi:PAS domain S-box-containing protein
MSWVTVVWSMIASACLTLATISWLVWYRNRTAWADLFFALTAASTAVFAFCELWLMRAATLPELLAAMRWGHVPLFCWLVSTTWFVFLYLRAGRRWLAWTICGLRAFYLLLNFLVEQNVNYREVTSLRQIRFLGESVTLSQGIPNPWMLLGHLSMLLILIFVADASVTAWRRGDRRKAVMIGGAVEFFLLLGLIETVLIFWGQMQAPIVFSLFFLGLVAVMGYELSHDVLRASQLVHDLQASEAGLRESEARMSLAVDAADIGLWVQDIARNELWANEKWRELFGFEPSVHLDANVILNRLHPDDREAVEHAHAMAIAGADRGRYQTEFRLMLPDATTQWISSLGRVECDAIGQPVRIRGTSRNVTAHKRAELAVRNLNGRLLSSQEDERRRIARELHDNLSQQVALLAIEIEQVAMKSEPWTAVAGSMRRLGAMTADISTEIHNLSHRLHSTKLEALGLEVAVQGHCRELRARGLHVQYRAENVPVPLSYEIALCLFRVVQEGLNNVIKHSGGGTAQVSLRGTSDALFLSIGDSGRGFDETDPSGPGGLGLASIGERLRLVGGEVTIRSRPGRGTTIDARVPLAHEGRATAVDTLSTL